MLIVMFTMLTILIKKVRMLIEDLVAVEGMPVGTAMLMYTGVGAAAVVVPLVLIGLLLLIMTRFKKRGENCCDVAAQFHTVCYSTHSISLTLVSDLCRESTHV